MEKKLIIIALVALMLALSGCMGDSGPSDGNDSADDEPEDAGGEDDGTSDGGTDDGGTESSSSDSGTDDGGTDGGGMGDGTMDDGMDDGGMEDGEVTGDTDEAMARCEAGATQTYTYAGPQGETSEMTVTVEGPERRDGTRYCKFRTDYEEMGLQDSVQGQYQDRTPDRVEWWASMDSLNQDTDRLDEGDAIMEMYDTNGNIMMSWRVQGDSFEMTMYDENGNEIDMGGFSGQMPDDMSGQMPEDMGG